MFVGHFAAGLACKAVEPRAGLGTYFAAAQGLDLLWPMLVLTGVEQVRIDPGNTAFTPLDFVSYPWSHSLVMALLWAVLFGALHYWRARQARVALWLGLAVFSHWILDWVSHRPDLPLIPGGETRVGLGLWHAVPATLAVESMLLVGALVLYLRRTQPASRSGTWGLAALVVVLAGIELGSLAAVPPSVMAVAVSGLGLWLFVAWGAWLDRRRVLLG